MRLTEDEVVVSDVFSSGFDSPKVKPPLEESVLDDPVPNAIPLLAPNLNPEPAAGWSDFLSSLEEAPNLKLSDELPNLNPDETVVSLEVVSDVELPNGTPNLNPPDDEEEGSVNEPPNLKPPDADPEVLSDVPNLKPPDPDPEVLSDVPNLKPPVPEVLSEVPNLKPPELEPEVPPALGSTTAPGLAV